MWPILKSILIENFTNIGLSDVRIAGGMGYHVPPTCMKV